jgi:hypothetical protein
MRKLLIKFGLAKEVQHVVIAIDVVLNTMTANDNIDTKKFGSATEVYCNKKET